MSNEELVREIKQGISITENLEKLYKNNKNFIVKIAKKYKGYAELDDLKQEGFIGLYNAIEPYDETQGTLFLTYAGHHIQQAIGRYIENNSKTVRIPSYLLSQMHKYRKVVNAYESIYDREPTDRELCKALSIDSKALNSLKGAINQFNQLESLDRPIQGADNEDMTLSSIAPDDTNVEESVIESMMENKIKTELWQIVKENTTEEENKVINARFRNNLTLEQVGQSIDKSRDMARQIEARALRKLRRPRCSRLLQQKFEVNMASAYRGSLSMFKNTWESSTERAALRNLELKGIQ